MAQNIGDTLYEAEGTSAPESNSSYDAEMLKLLRDIAKNTSSANQGDSRARSSDNVNRKFSTNTVGRRAKQTQNSKVQGGIDGFLDGVEDAVFGDFKKQMKSKLSDFASGLSDELGVSKEAIPNEIGKQLTKSAMNAFKGTKMGSSLSSIFGDAQAGVSALADKGLAAAGNAVKGLASGGNAAAAATQAASTAATTAAGTVAASGASMTAATTATAAATMTAGAALVAIAPAAAVVVGALIIFHQVSKAGKLLVEGFSALGQGLSGAANRSIESSRKATELAKTRMEADVSTLIETPFRNLEAAADALCSAWESSISTITATQGYTKEGLQDLISGFASRLRSEGLSRVVSSADITTSLEKVLQSGLSGAAAEEFAYMATVLGSAMPTQDFFSYASTYSSIAANAVKDGASQSAALAYANQEMEQFASNVLYASRQLAGGFSTGLQDTASLFEDAYKIVQSAKTGDTATVSGVLTSVSGVLGAIAPDLASGIVDAVVNSAIGGNNESTVALRSLAGVNASNTEFLKKLASDPKSIFSQLFTNLSKMQNMSSDNFMEVAEGLSDVFGISMDALARVDFDYLASAISQMSLNNSSLDENMKLLSDGQTTTTTEQMKIAEINQQMIDEGLTYILDNEASRAIQQHMWDEQLAMQMQEATYAVNLQGSAMTFLQKIGEAVKAITTLLNPMGAIFNKMTSLVATVAEQQGQDEDIKKLLELSNAGRTNAALLSQLTNNGGKQLNITDSLVSMMGGVSSYEQASKLSQFNNNLVSGPGGYDISSMFRQHFIATLSNGANKFSQLISGLGNTVARANIQSQYGWGTVSKSISQAIKQSSKNNDYYTKTIADNSLTGQIDHRTQSNFQSFLDTMKEFVDKEKSYDEWVSTSGRYGIKDVKSSIEDFGLTEAELSGKFTEMEAGKQAERTYQRQQTEDKFWADNMEYVNNTAPTFHENLLAAIAKFYKKYEEFYGNWVDYYINHTAYTSATLDAYKIEQILNADKTATGDAVNALADALLSNAVDLKDPAVQTNVLLSQVLVTLNGILQQNMKTNNSVLPTSLSALGLGLVSST